MYSDSSNAMALNRIKSTLKFSLREKYNKDKDSIVDFILNQHGLNKDNFDLIKNIEEFIAGSLADKSVDQNANKADKTIAGIQNEICVPIYKTIGYRYLYRELKELYGKKEAKRLSGELYDMSLAMHDSGKILLPYCWAFDSSKIVMQGVPWGRLKSLPPKRLSSYVDSLKEVIHQMASQLAGAIAISTFFFDFCHLLEYKEKVSLGNLKKSEEKQKYVVNCFQTFIHSVNNPMSRNNVESPFTNISLFDREKLKNYVKAENMGWYFQGSDSDYIVDYIMYLQELFMKFFDKGDPSSNGLPYPFPVVTINLSKKENDIVDKEFLAHFCKHDIYRYNILVSEGSKISSCCRLLSDSEMFELGGQTNSFGGTGISLGSHRAVTINFNRIALESKNYNDYYEKVGQRIDDASKVLIAHRKLLQETTKSGLHPMVKNSWIQLNKMFSTYGVIGLCEAIDTLKEKFGKHDKDAIAETLIILNDKAKYYTKETKTPWNIEQIPGETMAVRFAEIDRILFGEKLVWQKLYSNQFVPLWENKTIFERMDIDGKYNKLYTGGGICHFNLGEKITATQAKKVIDHAVSSGCEHFALNSIYSQCEKDHVFFGNNDKCPQCGGEIKERFTRVVGFFTPVSSWNKVRREWEFKRRKFTVI